ncbi:MAG: polysaccharide biosynthesis protein, partial [Coxiellaceae bacterium]|nr:polysaccharide biosynthesis protein [Coxiellaceae bacterium]
MRAIASVITKLRRSIVVIAHDITVIPLAWLGAAWLRFNLSAIPTITLKTVLYSLPLVLLIQVLMYQRFGLYRGVWRFASMPDLIRILKAVGAGVLFIAVALFYFNRLNHIPRSIFPLYAMLLTILLGGARFFFRWLKDYGRLLQGQRVLIVGAGQSGESLARSMVRDESQNYLPLAFVDDHQSRGGLEIHGIPVLGKVHTIPQLVKQLNVYIVMIALPGASAANMRRIVALCEQANVKCRTLPSLNDLTAGRVNIDALRQVSLEDLLGRDPVNLNWGAITEQLQGKRVLITGGAGSIGAELCRQVARLQPERLLIIDNNEYNLYLLQLEFEKQFPNAMATFHLVDVTDHAAITALLQKNHIDTIFHAAAYKHVPLLESQCRVAIKNNLLGTWCVAKAAMQAKVPKFVLISTDKAVHPANIMGATKRGAEIFCQNANRQEGTHFITVRFGNVLGSKGSVVPLFKKQIAAGGPITVTHPDITRYFMTIPEATQLILQASTLGKGGEIFVLDMGEP